MTQLKKQYPKYFTNNFLNYSELQSLSKKENVELLYNEEAIVILDNDNNVNRVYFILSSLENTNMLSKLLESGNLDKPYVIDCLGKEAVLENLKGTFERIGIKLYTRMNRWKAVELQNLYDIKSVDVISIAEENDVDDIERLLKISLDILVAHLPTKEEIKSLINNECIFCKKRDKQIISIICLKKLLGDNLYIYEYAVDKKYRGKGLGKEIVNYALCIYKDKKMYTSWIGDNNKYGENIHENFGFQKEGLKDYIFIYK